jgi:hypothetical protein
MIVVEASYRKKNPTDDWYDVMLDEQPIGEVYRTRKGYMGHCANAPKRVLGPTKKKEELGQLIVARWEQFPVRG